MDDRLLNQDEMDAIRSAINQSNRQAKTQEPTRDARPIALIVDDRAAEQALPMGLWLANGWAPRAGQTLERICDAPVKCNTVGAEVVTGQSLKEALPNTWTTCVRVSSSAGIALVVASGSMIEALAACRLGSELDEAAAERQPSKAAISLFATAGDSITSALVEAWQSGAEAEVTIEQDQAKMLACRRQLSEASTLVRIVLQVEGATSGRLALFARPELLATQPTPLQAIPAAPGAIEEALGGVPIELRVTLGHTLLSVNEFSKLAPGSTIALSQFVNTPVPVRCAGRLKAFGKAVVSGDMLAVEITRRAESEPV